MKDTRTSSATLAFTMCFLVALVEGFDLQAAGVAAPKMAAALQLAPDQLGWVFSTNAVGLLFGAAGGGWLADRYGRKFPLIASMALFGLFSIGTAFATDANSLYLMRFLTGVGLGGGAAEPDCSRR